jgi:hypothetical protein
VGAEKQRRVPHHGGFSGFQAEGRVDVGQGVKIPVKKICGRHGSLASFSPEVAAEVAAMDDN